MGGASHHALISRETSHLALRATLPTAPLRGLGREATGASVFPTTTPHPSWWGGAQRRLEPWDRRARACRDPSRRAQMRTPQD